MDIEMERLRAEAEVVRQQQEVVRQATERARITAEDARVAAEHGRRAATTEVSGMVETLTTLVDRMEAVEKMRRSRDQS